MNQIQVQVQFVRCSCPFWIWQVIISGLKYYLIYVGVAERESGCIEGYPTLNFHQRDSESFGILAIFLDSRINSSDSY